MGVKKSNFTALDNIPDDATLDFVSNGGNFKITKADFITALGVTGTLSQLGDPLGTPILNKAGTDNQIRILEAGSGINVSVSPNLGALIKHNFQQSAGGIAITRDIAQSSPIFSSLVAGTGMQVAKVGDQITITNTGTTLPATKAVAVNQESDFPTAIGGVITLEADTVYIISNDVTTANRFVRQDNTSIVGYSQLGPTLEYTGTETMFTSVDASTLIFGLRIKCPNGKVFDWTDTTGNTKVETFKESRIDSCVDIGDYTGGLALVIASAGSFVVTGRGIRTFGTGWSLISIDRHSQITESATFVGIDLGTSTASAVEINNLVFIGPSGAIGVTGAANSGNITAGNLAMISNCNFIGDITPITEIDPSSDIRWTSSSNDGIADSRDDSLISIQGNSSETIIAVQSTPVKMVGTWTDQSSSRFVVTLNGGRMTYVGERPTRLPIDCVVSALMASGGDAQVSAYVAINGTVVTDSKTTTTASSTKTGTLGLIWQHDFQPNDFIEVFLANDSTTVNVIGQSAVARID